MSWRDEAACRGSDPELFFPSSDSGSAFEMQVATAKAVCSRCPVRRQCLDEALERMPHGIAGGLTAVERATVRRGRARQRKAATAGERLAAGLVSVGQVAAAHGVSERTAYRWAERARAAQAASRTGTTAVAS